MLRNGTQLLLPSRGRGFARSQVRAPAGAPLVLEAPKIASYVDLMRGNIADALRIPPGQISVKATTHEGLGFIGGGDGAAAHAVVLITAQ